MKPLLLEGESRSMVCDTRLKGAWTPVRTVRDSEESEDSEGQ